MNHAGVSYREMAKQMMKGESFIVLESRMDAVIGLINLLLKLSKQRTQRWEEPFQIFKGENVLVKLLLIMEILAEQMNCGVGFLCPLPQSH